MGDQERNHVAVDIEEMLAKAIPPFTAECCIYRVPHEIRKLNIDAYTPQVVSIGPFHHGNPRLRNMEIDKQIYCQKFIKRIGSLGKSLDDLVCCVQELEPKVRLCYAENIKLRPEDIVKVILVDCCFIFESFLSNISNQRTDDDNIPIKSRLASNVVADLLLLENQLPFFVLEELYNLALADAFHINVNHPSFLQLTFRYFDDYNKQKLAPTALNSIQHFTDLLRTFHLQPSGRLPSRQAETLDHLNSVTELHEAGVKFKVNRESKCLLDLQFSGRCLEIPEVRVEDWTEILFRNMVALEQCHYPDESYITDYVQVLDFLINTNKDVDILVQNKIIVNWLGDSKAVAKLFNGLCKNIYEGNFNSDYLRIRTDLNNYCEDPCHSRMATLKHDYCKTPWQTVASFAAFVLLILTIIQTVCSILQVVLV